MWSFSDNLNYKLEFESPLEVVVLSFCPTDRNILLGGALNGQVILWDLQNRAEKLDYEEMLSSAQIGYRIIMSEFLKWAIQINETILVTPSCISRLENSQKSTITAIHWLSSKCFVNAYGKIYMDPIRSKKYRYFITSSLDGSVSFWNLDAHSSRKVSSGARRDLPKALTQSESVFKGKTLAPIFTVVFSEPITAVIADTPIFGVRYNEKDLKTSKNPYNYPIQVQESEITEVRQSCVISSFYGHLERISWSGLYADAEGRELVSGTVSFARVHDGPVTSMKRNPFFPWLFVSIGCTVLAVWKEDYNYSPIFWRRCQSGLTAVSWSESKPSVFFVTRIDGSLEAWDILCKWKEILKIMLKTQSKSALSS